MTTLDKRYDDDGCVLEQAREHHDLGDMPDNEVRLWLCCHLAESKRMRDALDQDAEKRGMPGAAGWAVRPAFDKYAERQPHIDATMCMEQPGVGMECLSQACPKHGKTKGGSMTTKRTKPERTEPPFATQPVARGRKLIATLGNYDRNGSNRLNVALMEFRGARYVDARIEYRVRDDEPWTPTSKGITLKRAEVESLAKALLRALDEWPVGSPQSAPDAAPSPTPVRDHDET